jgi:hypothetical protein
LENRVLIDAARNTLRGGVDKTGNHFIEPVQ